MTAPIAFQNGQFVAADRVSIPLHDAGFVWGATVTDRLRTFRGRLFRIEDHLARFRESCRLARVPLVFPDERIAEISDRLVATNHGEDELSLIWLATPGVLTGFASSDGRVPSFIAFTEKIEPLKYKDLMQDGATLWTRPERPGVDPLVKHRSRLPWWIALREVRESHQGAEPLFIDADTGCLLETSTANIFVVFADTLVSPPPGTVLQGVSAKVVEELAVKLGLKHERRAVHKSELKDATEMLLTNTSFSVAGVSCVDGASIPFPGPILERLRTAWSDLVGMDIHQ